MIRKGRYTDIDQILNITKSCATHLIAKNIFQWNSHYPNETVFYEDINRDELYVIEIESKIIGCICVSELMDDFYKPLNWLTPNTRNLYIHRLAINPAYQGKGYAQELMTFAETYGRKNNFCSVRLDTFSKNPRNQKFYQQRGYKKLDGIYFPKQSKYPFYCYELVL